MDRRLFIFILILIIQVYSLDAQMQLVGLGWAKNSVNTTIFRKNSVITVKGYQYTAYYDSTGHVVLAKRKTDGNRWEVKQTKYTGNIDDAHCSISIFADDDGYVHMAWGHHNTKLNYCKSITPYSLDLSDTTGMLGTEENDVTYPEFLKLPHGDILFMYRYGLSGNGNLVINRYSLREKKWVRLHSVLIDGQGQRNAYWQSYVDSKGTVHISWVWRETWDVSTNHDLCYAKSLDGGLTWCKSTGEPYTLPITAASAEYLNRIPQNSELINQTSMFADSHGRPYITTYWKPVGARAPQYFLVYLNDNSRWITKQISDRKMGFSLSGGGTKKIPISRPQVLVKEINNKISVYLIYRDVERGNKVSVNISANDNFSKWYTYDLTDFTVNSWEPSYDTEFWRDSLKLNIFVQNTTQGDSESLGSISSQPVYILEMPKTLIPNDSIVFINKAVR